MLTEQLIVKLQLLQKIEGINLSETKITFEESLNKLENIIKKLESADISLDDSIKLFEDGIKHITDCKSALKNAEEKIIKLSEIEKE